MGFPALPRLERRGPDVVSARDPPAPFAGIPDQVFGLHNRLASQFTFVARNPRINLTARRPGIISDRKWQISNLKFQISDFRFRPQFGLDSGKIGLVCGCDVRRYVR